MFLDYFDTHVHCDTAANIKVSLTTTPFTNLSRADDNHPKAHHITSLVGGNNYDSFELLFSILYALNLSKTFDANGKECFSGKFTNLKSLTFLFPDEFSGDKRDRLVTIIDAF
jgi:hypothetical protein